MAWQGEARSLFSQKMEETLPEEDKAKKASECSGSVVSERKASGYAQLPLTMVAQASIRELEAEVEFFEEMLSERPRIFEDFYRETLKGLEDWLEEAIKERDDLLR